MALNIDFDGITEPYEKTYIRSSRTRLRRNRVVLVLAGCLFLICMFWRNEIAESALASKKLAGYSFSPFSSNLGSVVESPLLEPSPPSLNDDGITVPSNLKKENPSFHLLILSSETNPSLCKTVLSAFILNYPPPTLINFHKFYADNDPKTHAAKLQGISDYLNNEKKVREDDLVLIIDDDDIWLQLSPDVMIKRFDRIIAAADERVKRKYGTNTRLVPGNETRVEYVPKYTSKVVFGASKKCWPNAVEDAACASVPSSTLHKNAYGPGTDEESQPELIRPRFLDSGSLIGPVSDLKAIYRSALLKAQKESYGKDDNQFILNELFGEQEYKREEERKAAQGAGGRWLSWLADALGTADALPSNVTINNITSEPGQHYEFGITLDYESQLFQEMHYSENDLDWLLYNDTETNMHILAEHNLNSWYPPVIPSEILHSPFPLSINDSRQDDAHFIPVVESLDTIPENLSWSTVPLATNLHSKSIPASLRFSSKTTLDEFWSKMWYHPYSRALLRKYMRSPQGPKAFHEASIGGYQWWDSRGGKGGVWTDMGEWLGWSEICKGYDEGLFDDGKGEWGNEEGGAMIPVYNSFGKLVAGSPAKSGGRRTKTGQTKTGKTKTGRRMRRGNVLLRAGNGRPRT
ncbi:MAG: hypothetical protein M1834_007161 [Cirrosporium novae-zelandiae]|nr:MAG: hypothetical protein M1834_007161 [Cirrosporium novae-zelandiae]